MHNNDLITQAIIYTLRKDYLYGLTLAKFSYEESSLLDTIGVSFDKGKVLCSYNLDFIKSISISSLSMVLVHEVLHIIFQHHSRRGDRDSLIWNIACDLAVNSLIDGIEQAFPDGLFASKFGFRYGLLAEQYYELLIDDKDRYSQSCDGVNGNSISTNKDGIKVGSFTELSDRVDEITQCTLDKELTQALDKCYNYGYNPRYSVENAIKEFSSYTSINWKLVLNKFAGFSIKKDKYSSYSKPNRRFGWGSKGHISSYTSKIIFAIDTSASMDISVLSKVQNELNKIRKIMNIDIEVIECDAEVQDHYTFNLNKEVNLSFSGRGGTSFSPVFKYIKDNKLNPDALIYFTDLYGSFPWNKPKYPVLWISTSNKSEAPFGKVIRIE